MTSTETEWTLSELGTRVEQALAVGYTPALSGRVRAVPDRRTIRYYTTLGLIDRPAELRGRTAYYRRRHLLQLVAIKRLQAEGHSLTVIQQRLAGLSDRALEKIAVLTDPSVVSPPAKEESPVARPEDFWAVVPAAVEAHVAPVSTAPAPAASEPPPGALPHVTPLTGLTLAEGVTVLLPGNPSPSGDDLRAVLRAAAPLLRELRSRGLVTV